jgi:hypothetical protein
MNQEEKSKLDVLYKQHQDDKSKLDVLYMQHQDDMRVIARQLGFQEGFEKGVKDGEAAKWVFVVMLIMWLVIAVTAVIYGNITKICPI